MIPFVNNGHLTPRQLNFNKRLSQCRVRVENSFALAKGKWRRIKFIHVRNHSILIDHITASFVLHNFLILNGEEMLTVRNFANSTMQKFSSCMSYVRFCVLFLLQEEELARLINENQVLGNEDMAEEEDGEDELFDGAQARGIEKRLFFMNDVLELP